MATLIGQDIQKALEQWRKGELVAIPTETVYGLAAPVNQKNLIQRIFELKERPLYDPLIIHVSDAQQAKNYALTWDSLIEFLVGHFWPGPLTLVLSKSSKVDDLITAGLDTVGLRCPQRDVTRELIKVLGHGLAAPSANKFTKTSPTSAEHVLESFKNDDVAVIDGGQCDGGIESTIIKPMLQKKEIKILRPGLITASEIKKALEAHSELALLNIKVTLGKTAVEKEQARQSPGQELVHYKPEYPLYYKFGFDGDVPKDFDVVRLHEDPNVCARELYAQMRKPLPEKLKARLFVIKEGVENVAGVEERDKELWLSILNRLKKAAQRWPS